MRRSATLFVSSMTVLDVSTRSGSLSPPSQPDLLVIWREWRSLICVFFSGWAWVSCPRYRDGTPWVCPRRNWSMRSDIWRPNSGVFSSMRTQTRSPSSRSYKRNKFSLSATASPHRRRWWSHVSVSRMMRVLSTIHMSMDVLIATGMSKHSKILFDPVGAMISAHWRMGGWSALWRMGGDFHIIPLLYKQNKNIFLSYFRSF